MLVFILRRRYVVQLIIQIQAHPAKVWDYGPERPAYPQNLPTLAIICSLTRDRTPSPTNWSNMKRYQVPNLIPCLVPRREMAVSRWRLRKSTRPTTLKFSTHRIIKIYIFYICIKNIYIFYYRDPCGNTNSVVDAILVLEGNVAERGTEMNGRQKVASSFSVIHTHSSVFCQSVLIP